MAKTANKEIEPKPKQTKTAKTPELVNQVVKMKQQRYSDRAVGRELGIDEKTVKRWYYDALGTPAPQELYSMRVAETLLHEQIIKEALNDLEKFTDPTEPDWSEYAGNMKAKVEAYGIWVRASIDTLIAKQKVYATIMRSSMNIADLNGLKAASKLEIQATVHHDNLDSRIEMLSEKMHALDMIR